MAQPQPTDLFKPASLYGVFFLMMAGFALVLVRLTVIQAVEHETWAKRAKGAQEKNVTIEAQRGAIFDRNGQILAMNVERPSVYAIPSEIENPTAVAKKLSVILGVQQD